MSNCKTIFCWVCCIAFLYGCKPYTQFFSYDHTVDKKFFDEVRPVLDAVGSDNDSIRVYRAYLTERLVERDNVPEYKLINAESKQEYVKLADSKNFHYLYLFELFPKNSGDTVIVYMGTAYAADSTCTGLGPVYAGFLRNNGTVSRIQFEIAMKVKRVTRNPLTQEEKKGTKTREDDYELDPVNYKKMVFINQSPAFGAGKAGFVQVDQVIRKDPNKIGGEKELIFTTEKVFGDPAALVFTYFSTIK